MAMSFRDDRQIIEQGEPEVGLLLMAFRNENEENEEECLDHK